jgi:hypothetical protein
MLLRNLYVDFIVVIKFLLIENAVQIALTAIPTSIRVLSRIIEAVKSMSSYRTQINIMAKGSCFPFQVSVLIQVVSRAVEKMILSRRDSDLTYQDGRPSHRKWASVISSGPGFSTEGVDLPELGKLGVKGVAMPDALSVMKRTRCRCSCG